VSYSTPTKCIQCGRSEVSEFFDVKQGRIVICGYCGHRVAADSPQSVVCFHCKSTRATEFYDEQAGVVIECPDCGHRKFSGESFVEYPRVVECPQCGNTQASESDDDGFGIMILCLECGREENKGPVCDDKGNVCGWIHEVKFGAGCLQYRQKSDAAVTWCPLHTTEEAAECEKVTRERLRNGEYVPKDTCLTRWDLNTRQTVTVLFI
jgi:DNA-directed RNA polymerase subunit RPC12/RpoP